MQEDNSVGGKESVESVAIERVMRRCVNDPVPQLGESEGFAFPEGGVAGIVVPGKVEEGHRCARWQDAAESVDELIGVKLVDEH